MNTKSLRNPQILSAALMVVVVMSLCAFTLALPQIPKKPLIDPIPLSVLAQLVGGITTMVLAVCALKWRLKRDSHNNGSA